MKVGSDDLLQQVRDLLGSTFSCSCGRRHVVETQGVSVGPGALEQVVVLVDRYFGSGPLLVVADENTYAAAGEQVVNRLSAVRKVDVLVLCPVSGQPAGDERSVRQVRGRLEHGFAAAIAVGAGTINDLVKLAALEAQLPDGVVATAAAMNGYTSAI
ncbi:MAG: iron-containing alcohol dehydrogenase, partial [Armatimonadetes bacterium]|nr:iron-containing alcohol dehydrogenase [Armatimonadota bacterium]